MDRLEGKEVLQTRELWEEIFSEDEPAFVDYYYKEKAPENITFVLREKEELIAMLHLTPYQGAFGPGKDYIPLHYIVGVATKEEYRHKGCMAKLLEQGLRELYARQEPFAFLMPANPKIYEPFGFRYIYDREEYGMEEALSKELKSGLWVRKAGEEDAKNLAEFANGYLRLRYDLYLHRTEEYYRKLLAETASQQGGILLVERAGNDNSIINNNSFIIEGSLVYVKEKTGYFVQEVLFSDVKDVDVVEQLCKPKGQKKPIIMARVIYIEALLSCIKSLKQETHILKITDTLLPENNGIFLWKPSIEGNTVKRLEGEEAAVAQVTHEFAAEELIEYLFKDCRVFINEIV